MFMTKNEKRKEIVLKIKNLRDRGATFQEISDQFNKDLYATVGGFTWTPQSLHRFLKIQIKKGL